MHERSGRKTDTTGGAKKHQYARCEATRDRTKICTHGGRRGGIGGHSAAFGCGGYPLQAKCRLGARRAATATPHVAHAAHCARARAVLADLKPRNIQKHCQLAVSTAIYCIVLVFGARRGGGDDLAARSSQPRARARAQLGRKRKIKREGGMRGKEKGGINPTQRRTKAKQFWPCGLWPAAGLWA
jgi:hypothetical protein